MILQTLEGGPTIRPSISYVDSVEGRIYLHGEDQSNYYYVFETEALRGVCPGLNGLNGFKIKMPKIKFKIKMPKIKMPKLKLPKFSMPKLKLKFPKIDLGKFYNNAVGKPLATFGRKTGEAFAAAAQMPMDLIGQTMGALGNIFPGAGISQMGNEGMTGYEDAADGEYSDPNFMDALMPSLLQPAPSAPAEFFDPMEAGSPAEYMTRDQQTPAQSGRMSPLALAAVGVGAIVLFSTLKGGRRRR